jgi:hypothetical protein
MVRCQPKVVKTSPAGGLQALGGLTGDPAGLLCGQWPLKQDGGQRLGPASGLLDDEGGVGFSADIQDSDKPHVLYAGRPPGCVQDAGAVGVSGADNSEGDVALERDVEGKPALDVRAV